MVKVRTSCPRPRRPLPARSGTRTQHTTSSLPTSSPATRSTIASSSTTLSTTATSPSIRSAPATPGSRRETTESSPRARSNNEGPKATPNRPTQPRPHTTKEKRRHGRPTHHFPPGTGERASAPHDSTTGGSNDEAGNGSRGNRRTSPLSVAKCRNHPRPRADHQCPRCRSRRRPSAVTRPGDDARGRNRRHRHRGVVSRRSPRPQTSSGRRQGDLLNHRGEGDLLNHGYPPAVEERRLGPEERGNDRRVSRPGDDARGRDPRHRRRGGFETVATPAARLRP